MENNRKPNPGECYRHFKGRRYQVLAVAQHTEREEVLVIYQGLYGEHPVFARPIEMFTGKVDKKKFPDVSQEYRFELEEETAVCDGKKQQMILEFLELESSAEKIKFLQARENQMTEEFLMAAAMSMDFTLSADDTKLKYEELMKYLSTIMKYERR